MNTERLSYDALQQENERLRAVLKRFLENSKNAYDEVHNILGMNYEGTMPTISAGKDNKEKKLGSSCPKCRLALTALLCTEDSRVEYLVTLRKDGEREDRPNYVLKEVAEVLPDTTYFMCPSCGAELFESEDDAISFLKGQATKRSRGARNT